MLEYSDCMVLGGDIVEGFGLIVEVLVFVYVSFWEFLEFWFLLFFYLWLCFVIGLFFWFGFGGVVCCCSFLGFEVEERVGYVEIIVEVKGFKSFCCFNVLCIILWNGF